MRIDARRLSEGAKLALKFTTRILYPCETCISSQNQKFNPEAMVPNTKHLTGVAHLTADRFCMKRQQISTFLVMKFTTDHVLH